MQGSADGAGFDFSKRSPGAERRAALWAGVPVWLPSLQGQPHPDSRTSSRRLCPPAARRFVWRWCCPWHWPRKTQNLRKEINQEKTNKLCLKAFKESKVFQSHNALWWAWLIRTKMANAIRNIFSFFLFYLIATFINKMVNKPLLYCIAICAKLGLLCNRVRKSHHYRRNLTEVLGKLSAPLSGHDPLIFHITFVAHQKYLGIIPRVCLNLCGPVED